MVAKIKKTKKKQINSKEKWIKTKTNKNEEKIEEKNREKIGKIEQKINKWRIKSNYLKIDENVKILKKKMTGKKELL